MEQIGNYIGIAFFEDTFIQTLFDLSPESGPVVGRQSLQQGAAAESCSLAGLATERSAQVLEHHTSCIGSKRLVP
jgi:hypothetical protein